MAQETLRPGARALVDGRYLVVVRQAFPEGSTSYLFPHYVVDYVNGDRRVAVHINRVGFGYSAPKRVE